MIEYTKVKRGDILCITGVGAPGWAAIGDLVRVVKAEANGVTVEDKRGQTAEFLFNCGRERLEPTEWTNDFPEGQPCST